LCLGGMRIIVLSYPAAAQFVETDCPLRHPEIRTAKLDTIVPLEDGFMSHDLPDFYYKQKDGSKIGIIDYRFSNDLIYRNARLLCRYDKAPDLLLDIPGLLTRCVLHYRATRKSTVYIRGFCESDISPSSETAVKPAGQ